MTFTHLIEEKLVGQGMEDTIFPGVPFQFLYVPYCYYYKRVLILANIGDLVITAKFCARY